MAQKRRPGILPFTYRLYKALFRESIKALACGIGDATWKSFKLLLKLLVR